MHARFRFRRGAQELPLEVAATADDGPPLATVTVEGRGRGGPDVLSVPYRGGRLVADDLDAQLDRWLAAGTAEPSFAAAVRAVMAHPAWLDLAGVTVVVLGAGAQMGPLVSLLGWGAHVVAVDLPNPQVWSRLIEVARSGPGRLLGAGARPVAAGAPDGEIAVAAGVTWWRGRRRWRSGCCTWRVRSRSAATSTPTARSTCVRPSPSTR